jgi:predicted Zn finger-like uncharacterized protein
MSLITRCPACETMFRVVPDQLRVSEGWVRCGQCGEIFDASQHLLPDPHDATHAPIADPVEANPVIDAVAEQPVTRLPPASGQPTQPAQELPDIPDLPSAPQHVAEPVVHAFIPEPPASEPPWAETVVPEQPVIDEPDPAFLEDEPAPATRAVITPRTVEDDAPDVSFMRDRNRKTIWQRRGVRIVLLLIVALLLVALAAQVLIHERDRIAATEPRARPALLALCAWSRCALSPLRQIESIVIESSSFTLTRGDNYKLAFSLKNNALLDLAMPAIELALTDAQDQPVIRRVILPSEFGAASHPLAAGSEWSSSVAVSVKASATMDRIAGYRMLAFYP